MNVSLPTDLRSFVEEKLARDCYSSASEYVRELIRGDLKREAREKVDQFLLEALESGPAEPVTKKEWQDIRQEVRARIASAKKHANRPKADRTD